MLSLLSRRDSLLAWPRTGFHPRAGAPAPMDPEQADLLVLANGLQRLLARCPRAEAARHFPAAVRSFAALRSARRLGRAPRLSAQLLSDLCHEIAEHVELPVRQAAVRCLRQATRRAAEARLAG